MWLGEQISDYGIGNGISIIIFAGIVARIPAEIIQTWSLVRIGEVGIISILAFLIVIVFVIAGVVAIQQGQRRIPVQLSLIHI